MTVADDLSSVGVQGILSKVRNKKVELLNGLNDICKNINGYAQALSGIEGIELSLVDNIRVSYDTFSNTDEFVVGECVNYKNRDDRIVYLFGDNGLPTTSEEAFSYMTPTPIEVPVKIYDENGNLVDATKLITVHKKLADDYYAIFQELAYIGFPMVVVDGQVDPDGGAYNFRKKNGGSSGLSEHSYGTAIDINPGYNRFVLGPNPDSDSPYAITPEVVEIFKKHGFYWGGDWDGKHDYMHFTYLGG